MMAGAPRAVLLQFLYPSNCTVQYVLHNLTARQHDVTDHTGPGRVQDTTYDIDMLLWRVEQVDSIGVGVALRPHASAPALHNSMVVKPAYDFSQRVTGTLMAGNT
jgi:hypothetical protein